MPDKRTIFVCHGTGCISSGSDAVYEALREEIAGQGITDVEVDFTGCHGFCEQGPNVVVEPEGIFYTHVQAEDAPEIVGSHLREGKPVQRLFYHEPLSGKAIPRYSEMNFYNKQQRVILRNCGHINPEKIDHYIAANGYRALKKALLQMTPEQVIEEVKRSGLRGRGGAGFPTGRKWEFCRNVTGDKKYAICNADEGDPGAFMDRSILEADPHAVIEGLTIAAYAMGATEGYIYVRAEYPLAVRRIRIALEQATQRTFLGNDILGSGFDFAVHIKEGAGAFVCGEETALMASIESRRGRPRPPPPLPRPVRTRWKTYHYQQRQEPGLRPRHHRPRGRLVRQHRH
jgi:(2Fe-2S) ferredoxin